MTLDPVCMSDPPHGTVPLFGTSFTIGRKGCLLVSLVMAARKLTRKPVGVLEAMELIRAGQANIGSNIIIGRAALELGMATIERTEYSPERLAQWIDLGSVALLGVDYRPGKSSGFSDADHFVLAVDISDAGVTVADPATGRFFTYPARGVFAYRTKQGAEWCEMTRLVALRGVE